MARVFTKGRNRVAAYMMIACKIHDRNAFLTGYSKAVAPLVAKMGGEYILLAPGAQLLEGTLQGYSSVAMSKWPDKATALAFWESPEYAQAKKLRAGIADCDVILVEAP